MSPDEAHGEQRARILFVDDDPCILDGFTRSLRWEFAVTTASNGTDALEVLSAADAPFAVVVSDMMMPGMDGAAFLERAQLLAPDTVRVLLTGHADLASAISAVNNGRIYRFLTKPCPRDELVVSLGLCIEQHQLLTARRELLEQTLRGSIDALLETLALANPVAFARATRIKRIVVQLVRLAGAPDAWRVEVAAMLSQLGAVTLPVPVAEKLHAGLPLDPDEQAQVDRFPMVAEQLLGNIPRLDSVRQIIRLQAQHFDGTAGPQPGLAGDDIPTGARILAVAAALDALTARGIPRNDALDMLTDQVGVYDPNLLAVLRLPARNDGPMVVRVAPRALQTGMVLAQDVRTATGVLLIGRGQQVTPAMVGMVHNWIERGGLTEPVLASLESPTDAAPTAPSRHLPAV
jgi:response regulator RpfG family c-di-GMP phosphodiesterase